MVAALILFLLAFGSEFIFLAAVGFILGFFLSALPIGLEMSAELVGSAMAGSASSLLWLFSQAGSVIFIWGMDAVKSMTEELYPSNPYYMSIIFILVFDIVALALCLMPRETGRKSQKPKVLGAAT